jgi:hypothetical protein
VYEPCPCICVIQNKLWFRSPWSSTFLSSLKTIMTGFHLSKKKCKSCFRWSQMFLSHNISDFLHNWLNLRMHDSLESEIYLFLDVGGSIFK